MSSPSASFPFLSSSRTGPPRRDGAGTHEATWHRPRPPPQQRVGPGSSLRAARDDDKRGDHDGKRSVEERGASKNVSRDVSSHWKARYYSFWPLNWITPILTGGSVQKRSTMT